MARALLVVHRRPADAGMLESWVSTLNRRLTPDNVVVRKPRLARDKGVTAVVFNANGAVRLRSTSVMLGMPVGPAESWHTVGTEPPDGSYALLRNNAHKVELIADATASRTIWYTKTRDCFIASTSQRAIVALLGSFELDTSAVPWMLSSGTLGPGGGWDARIKPVLPAESVVLERASWEVTRHVEPVVFRTSSHRDEGLHARRLAEALEAVGKSLPIDPRKWLLPLSGGVDSRGLLALMHERTPIRTLTWGLEAAPRRSSNDARIARRVARHFGVENRFFPTNLSVETRDSLIQRFLVAGEGRVANIPPFLDGFAIWQTLHDEDIDGVVRGDQAFGSCYVRDESDVRRATKLETLADYFSPGEVAAFELPSQVLPERLARRSGETLATWRDRLYQQHRLPRMLAGLTDLKSPYVEVANPLLTRSILDLVRTLPDTLRTDKRLWREFVRARSPDIPYARRVAVLPIRDFLNDTAMLELMLESLHGERDGDALSPTLVDWICVRLRRALATQADQRVGARTRGPLALVVPDTVRGFVRRWWPAPRVLSPTEIAFRAFIVAGMTATLKADATALTAEMRSAANL